MHTSCLADLSNERDCVHIISRTLCKKGGFLRMGTADGLSSSPYFGRNSAPPKTHQFASNSPYFLRSPASVHGSYLTLGSACNTWISGDSFNLTKECQRLLKNRTEDRQTDGSAMVVCVVCSEKLAEAVSHFRDCHHFQWHNPRVLGEIDHEKSLEQSCFEIFAPVMEEKVRHLCEDQCYLRAYAPCRDWWSLRQALLNKVDQCIDEPLRDWSCKLVRVDASGAHVKMLGSITPRKLAHPKSKADFEINMGPRKRKKISSSDPRKLPFDSSGNECAVGSSSIDLTNRLYPRTVFWNRRSGQCHKSHLDFIRIASSIAPATQATSGGKNLAGVASTCLSTDDSPFPPELQIQKCMSPRVLPYASTTSPLGLLEELFADNPWRLLMSTILLNRTRRNQVDGALSRVFSRWPTPAVVVDISNGQGQHFQTLVEIIAPLGIKNRRAKGIVRFCKDYMALVKRKKEERGLIVGVEQSEEGFVSEIEFTFTRQEVLSLFHCGDYCADAYQIFVQRKFDFHPRDHALLAYVEWQKSVLQSNT